MLRIGPGDVEAAIDAEDGVRVEGAAPGARVEVRAELELCGQEWSCTGEYVAYDSTWFHINYYPSPDPEHPPPEAPPANCSPGTEITARSTGSGISDTDA